MIRRCVHGKEALDILKACHITVQISPPKRSLMPNSFGLQVTRMHTSWLKIMTRANDKEKFHKGMRCLKIPSKFGAPRAIISDRRTHFCNDQFTKVMLKYGVTHRLSTAYHPQTSGQDELQKHPSVALRQACNGKASYENSLIYKEKTKRIHDGKIKNRVFNIGVQVILFNSRLKIFSSKLKSRWSGPFTIVQVFPYGTVELSQNSGPNFKGNGHRLKHYFGGDVLAMDIPDLQTFPKDN
ncbi:reverse transcriptase domain-containing protein [Tanacetum coccineum]